MERNKCRIAVVTILCAVLCTNAWAEIRAEPARLTVKSDPTDAKVFINGYLKSKTPGTLEVWSVGRSPAAVRVTIVLPDREKSDQYIWLKSGDSRTMQVQLVPVIDSAALKQYLPDGATDVAALPANIGAGPETELAVLYVTSRSAAYAGDVNLVILTPAPDGYAEMFRRLKIGTGVAAFLTPVDINGDGLTDILCQCGEGSDTASTIIVGYEPRIKQVRVLGQMQYPAKGQGAVWTDLTGDGVPEFLVDVGPHKSIPGARSWQLYYWNGASVVHDDLLDYVPFRPAPIIPVRAESVEGITADAPVVSGRLVYPLPGTDPKSPGGIGQFGISWDLHEIHFVIEVNDAVIDQPYTDTGIVNGDNVQVWLDRKLGDDFAVDAMNADDVHFAISPGDFTGMPPELVMLGDKARTIANVGLRAERTPKGYRLRCDLPYSALGMDRPPNGTVMGFAMAIVDLDPPPADTPDAPPHITRRASVSNFEWNHPATFENLLFIGQ